MKYKGQSKVKIKVDKRKERNYIARDMMNRNGPYKPKVVADKRRKYRMKWDDNEKAEYNSSSDDEAGEGRQGSIPYFPD